MQFCNKPVLGCSRRLSPPSFGNSFYLNEGRVNEVVLILMGPLFPLSYPHSDNSFSWPLQIQKMGLQTSDIKSFPALAELVLAARDQATAEQP